jgi:hypothetical protein
MSSAGGWPEPVLVFLAVDIMTQTGSWRTAKFGLLECFTLDRGPFAILPAQWRRIEPHRNMFLYFPKDQGKPIC